MELAAPKCILGGAVIIEARLCLETIAGSSAADIRASPALPFVAKPERWAEMTGPSGPQSVL